MVTYTWFWWSHGWSIMSQIWWYHIWDMILQCGSTIKVSIELLVATRHLRDMTEKMLKATLNPIKHTHTRLNIPNATIAQLIFEKLLASCIRRFIYCLVVNFWVCSPPLPSMPFCQQIFFANSHNISKWHPGSRGRGAGGRGDRVNNTKKKNKKKKRWKKYEKIVVDYIHSYIIFEASAVQMYLFMVVIVAKQVSRCLNVYI